MLHLIEHIRNLLRTRIAGNGRQRRSTTQRIARLTEPRYRVPATLQHQHGESQNARQSDQTIRRGRVESIAPLPPGTRSQTHLEQPILFNRRQFQCFRDSLICPNGKPSFDFFEQINARGADTENLRAAENVDDVRGHSVAFYVTWQQF